LLAAPIAGLKTTTVVASILLSFGGAEMIRRKVGLKGI